MSLTIGNQYSYLNYPNNITRTTNTIDNNSVTSQAKPSQNSTQTNDSGLHTDTIQFVMKNGMAESAYVDGIKMNLSDMFLKDKSQLKARINEEYNKTDAEKLEEIFGL
ncbi:hypothetical protein [Clostridium sp. BL-8]|uniref:hypothetical protein n=1 Tax=Clostridium sp. BL-8 TaxID=349938 RepID=UPI00098CA756|nr:hypothetical protein [Clostridium sp. BL-8]OOM77607.1 hypothetical protein CLOBL_28640 [Clostridium sp. BL-8]